MIDIKTKIVIATALGSALVAYAFVAHQQIISTQTEESSVRVASSDRSYIPVYDTNGDGVPDWQDQVIDSEPIFIEASSSEPYTPTDTITGRFGYELMTDPLIVDQSPMSVITKQYLAQSYVDRMEAATQAHVYTIDDLNIIETDNKDALRSYGNIVGGIIYYSEHLEENESELFNRFTQDKNPKHLEKLALIETQYETIIQKLLEQEVPQNYTYEHLLIVNAFSNVREDVHAMQQYLVDPLYTVMRYRHYAEDMRAVSYGITTLYDALYLDEQIEFEPDDTLRYLADNLR